MKLVVIFDYPKEPVERVGMSGARSVVTPIEGNKVLFQTYTASGTLDETFEMSWVSGSWLILAGAGKFSWHQPGIVPFRDQAYREGRYPLPTRRFDRELAREGVTFEMLASWLHGTQMLVFSDGYINIEDVNGDKYACDEPLMRGWYKATYRIYEDGREWDYKYIFRIGRKQRGQ